MAQRSTKGMWQALGYGLAALMVGVGGYFQGRAHEPEQAPARGKQAEQRIEEAPQENKEPKPALQPPLSTEPTTDPGVQAARLVELHTNQVVERLERDLQHLRDRSCDLEKQLRLEVAARVKLEADARRRGSGQTVSDWFTDNEKQWTQCLVDPTGRTTLSETALQALSQRH